MIKNYIKNFLKHIKRFMIMNPTYESTMIVEDILSIFTEEDFLNRKVYLALPNKTLSCEGEME